MEPILEYLRTGVTPRHLSQDQRKKLAIQALPYTLICDQLYKLGPNGTLRRCLHPAETQQVLTELHDGPAGGHLAANLTATKVLQASYWWPTLNKDAWNHCRACDRCQKSGSLAKAGKAALQSLQPIAPFM